jgi:hypothetical protein
MRRWLFFVAASIAPALFASVASAQYRPPPPAPRIAPLTTTNGRNTYAPWSGANAANAFANRSANLRAAPLPPDTLANSSIWAGAAIPARSVYSVPYGPNFTRPSGSPIVPFGSSRYYYHR